VRDLTTSSEAPIFKAPSNMPNKTCVPRGSNGRPNTRHSRDESRAAHKETSPQAAHGPKPVAPQPPDSRLRQPEQKRSVFVEKHVWLNWLKPATSILFWVFQVGVRPLSSVDRRSEPRCNAGVNLNLPPAKVSEESGIQAESSSSHKFETFKRFSLSVNRRAAVFHRAFFEDFGFPPAKKIW
jgi:hypothetical protein